MSRFFTIAAMVAIAGIVAAGSVCGTSEVPKDAVVPVGDSFVDPRDGSVLIRIPGGAFTMGEGIYQHRVTLADYYIGKLPVTNKQYRQFLAATGYANAALWREYADYNPSLFADNQPVESVTWWDAIAYCRWAGMRLPTEAEWEKAASGTDGRVYPWGNQWDGNRCSNSVGTYENSWQVDTISAPPVVGHYPSGASPYGILDMVGGVPQWCSSRLETYPYKATDGREDPTGRVNRVVRGGGWGGQSAADFRCTARGSAVFDSRKENGFRLAGPQTPDSPPRAATPGPTPVPPTGGFHEVINAKDGSVLVLIPAGSFTMGCNDGDAGEKPQHKVTLPAFYMARYPIVNSQWRKFEAETGYHTSGKWRQHADAENAPVVPVTWLDAQAYCTWAGLRLPTEAEWEKAARGTDGRRFPWGDEWNDERCWNNENDGGAQQPVGQRPLGASPYGLQDMVGNLMQWTSTRPWGYPYHADDGREDPTAPGKRIMRGGGGGNQYTSFTYYRTGESTDTNYGDLGLRCAASESAFPERADKQIDASP